MEIDGVPTRSLRVVDLREKLTEMGLETGGRKADLVARLEAALSEREASKEAEDVGEAKDAAPVGEKSDPEESPSTSTKRAREESDVKDDSDNVKKVKTAEAPQNAMPADSYEVTMQPMASSSASVPIAEGQEVSAAPVAPPSSAASILASLPVSKSATASFGGSMTPVVSTTGRERVYGDLKFFNLEKAFGFIIVDGKEIFVHESAIINTKGTVGIPDGSRVELEVGNDDMNRVRAFHVTLPGSIPIKGVRNMLGGGAPETLFPPHTTATLPFGRSRGKCKWFDNARGFGFITAEDNLSDVFVHNSDIKTAEGKFRNLAEGENLELTLVTDETGKRKGTDVTGPGGIAVVGAIMPPQAPSRGMYGQQQGYGQQRGYGGNQMGSQPQYGQQSSYGYTPQQPSYGYTPQPRYQAAPSFGQAPSSYGQASSAPSVATPAQQPGQYGQQQQQQAQYPNQQQSTYPPTQLQQQSAYTAAQPQQQSTYAAAQPQQQSSYAAAQPQQQSASSTPYYQDPKIQQQYQQFYAQQQQQQQSQYPPQQPR